MNRTTATLRQGIIEGRLLMPSCYDSMSARLAEVVGFKAAHLSGLAVEATLLGAPDLGLLSMSELVAHVARITSTIGVPLLVDVDTGFGGVLNVQRTIREMERAGAGGIHIEDQALPKHCPLLPGRAVVSRGEALDRIKAALDARTDPDFVIIARTDADTISFEETVERANLYLEAGADAVMPQLMLVEGRSLGSFPPEEQMAWIRRLAAAIEGPVMNMGGRPPEGYTVGDLFDAGMSIVIFSAALPAAANAIVASYRDVLETGSCVKAISDNPGPYWDSLALMREMHLDRYVEAEQKYSEAAR